METNISEKKKYKSLSAQQAYESNYGNSSYWDYLDRHAEEMFLRGISDAFTRSLSECLKGNSGD